MSDIVSRTGTFRAKATDWGIGVTSEKGCPQFNFVAHLTEYWDEDDGQWVDYSDMNESIPAYLTLVSGEGKILKNMDQVKKVFDWNGESFTTLAEGDYSETGFQIRIEDNDPEYADKNPFTVTWLDEYDATPGRSVAKLDAKGLKDLDKQFGALLKKSSGPSKPKSAPKNPKAKATTKPKATTAKPKTNAPSDEIVVPDPIVVDGKETIESKMARNKATQERNAAKRAKTEANKEKLVQEQAEAASKVSAKKEKPKAPKRSMPSIGKKPEPDLVPEVDETPGTLELTKDEAWERICAAQEQVGDDCTDEMVQAALIESCQIVSETDEPDVDTFTNEQWGQVTELTVQTLVGV